MGGPEVTDITGWWNLSSAMCCVTGGKSPYLSEPGMQTGENVSNLPSSGVGNGWKALSTVHIQGVFIWSWLLFFKMCLINMW